jgi:hypothetical protein
VANPRPKQKFLQPKLALKFTDFMIFGVFSLTFSQNAAQKVNIIGLFSKFDPRPNLGWLLLL